MMEDYEKKDLEDAINECERLSHLFPSRLMLMHALDIEDVDSNDWAFDKSTKLDILLCDVEKLAQELGQILREIKEKSDE